MRLVKVVFETDRVVNCMAAVEPERAYRMSHRMLDWAVVKERNRMSIVAERKDLHLERCQYSSFQRQKAHPAPLTAAMRGRGSRLVAVRPKAFHKVPCCRCLISDLLAFCRSI